MDKSDGRFVPYVEVPKDEDSLMKKKFMTSKEGALQATSCFRISTRGATIGPLLRGTLKRSFLLGRNLKNS